MLTVLRPKSQITIPSSVISSLGLKEGDQLDVYEDAGSIRIMPVAVYPKEYVNRLRSEIDQLKENIAISMEMMKILRAKKHPNAKIFN